MVGEWQLDTLLGELTQVGSVASSAEATLLQQQTIGTYLVLATSGAAIRD